MKTEGAMPRRVLLRQPNSVILPDELIVEIISWLPVKPLIQFRCVNKFYKTLIFDPHFVQMHFNKSSRNSHLALVHSSNLVTLSIPSLLQNQFTSSHQSLRINARVVGSCNGLLCLVGDSYSDNLICFYNPSMKTKSKYFTMLLDLNFAHYFKYSFGYDNSTCTYKAVAFGVKFVKFEKYDRSNPTSVVKVFSLGDNCWRDIQCFPMLPLYLLDRHRNNGVHLNGTINWLANDGDDISSNNGFYSIHSSAVIVSLDLSTETYTQLLLPWRSEKVKRPKLVVLMDCLCSCRDFEETHFVIWKMKHFGVQESWIQLFKISYENFRRRVDLLPLYLSKNGDTLVLANEEIDEAFNCNCIDNSVEELEISNPNLIPWAQAKEYAESLASTH